MTPEKTLFMLFEVMVVVFEMFIVYQYLKNALYRNSKSRLFYLLSYVLFGSALAVLSLYCRDMPMVLLTSTFLGVLLIAVFFYEGKTAQKLYTAVVFAIINHRGHIGDCVRRNGRGLVWQQDFPLGRIWVQQDRVRHNIQACSNPSGLS
jgi:hypothetical protein